MTESTQVKLSKKAKQQIKELKAYQQYLNKKYPKSGRGYLSQFENKTTATKYGSADMLIAYIKENGEITEGNLGNLVYSSNKTAQTRLSELAQPTSLWGAFFNKVCCRTDRDVNGTKFGIVCPSLAELIIQKPSSDCGFYDSPLWFRFS